MKAMSFQGKVALVTGSSRGIGRAIAGGLAARGARLALNHPGDDADRARVAADAIRAEGGEAEVFPADVSHPGEVRRMMEGILGRYGGIDIAVNNAGICPFRSLFDITPEEWDRVLEVNTRGIFLVSQAAARAMVERGGGGRIVNVTSISGLRVTDPRQIAYSTSKAAANMLTRCLAVALASHGITVNAVLPGTIPTDINAAVLSDPSVVRAITDATPLGSLGSPGDVVSAVLYLASDDASWVTGSLLVVDGGYVA